MLVYNSQKVKIHNHTTYIRRRRCLLSDGAYSATVPTQRRCLLSGGAYSAAVPTQHRSTGCAMTSRIRRTDLQPTGVPSWVCSSPMTSRPRSRASWASRTDCGAVAGPPSSAPASTARTRASSERTHRSGNAGGSRACTWTAALLPRRRRNSPAMSSRRDDPPAARHVLRASPTPVHWHGTTAVNRYFRIISHNLGQLVHGRGWLFKYCRLSPRTNNSPGAFGTIPDYRSRYRCTQAPGWLTRSTPLL